MLVCILGIDDGNLIMLLKKIIPALYALLFVTIPLALYLHTSEIFEFNKITLLYIFTILIGATWTIEMIKERRIIFKRTLPDIPLLIFLTSQGISTLLSIDFRTSLLGYYSRFNGGFLSILCFALLYWIWVSTMNRHHTIRTLYFLLLATIPVSLYGILQHFGIDKDLWVQDVQSRVFSTLGQPNWLAAWVAAIMPITWVFVAQRTLNPRNKLIFFGLSFLLFVTLLFTKSRSGFLAFGIESILFWTLIFFDNWKRKAENGKFLFMTFVVVNLAFGILAASLGTPFSPKLTDLFANHSQPARQEAIAPIGTQLDVGGTESGTIRQIVWRGAIDIWKHYPIFGSGVETFAFAYYQFKPIEHNYTSEWDYLYNKAHNEYLNYLSTTGISGLGAYLAFAVFSVFLIFNNSQKAPGTNPIEQSKIRSINAALVSGYISILVTNFFGFSVVPVSLLLFLFPAFAVSLATFESQPTSHTALTTQQKVIIGLTLLSTCYLLLTTFRYWYADLLYASGKMKNDIEDYSRAHTTLSTAIDYSPNESVFWDELSETDLNIAITLSESGKTDEGRKFATQAAGESKKAIDLSPANVNLKRNAANSLTKLSAIDPNYLSAAHAVLLDAIKYAPTDPKLQFALAASYYRLGQLDRAAEEMKKVIAMKKDHFDSHYALALIYVDAKEFEKAKEEFRYILEHMDPNNEQVKKELQELENAKD